MQILEYTIGIVTRKEEEEQEQEEDNSQGAGEVGQARWCRTRRKRHRVKS